MSLPRSTAPLRSIATWSEFQPPKSRRGRVEDKSCKALPAAPTLQLVLHECSGVTMESAALDPCPRRATLGLGKNEKHPASKSAQAAPSDMPLATSLG